MYQDTFKENYRSWRTRLAAFHFQRADRSTACIAITRSRSNPGPLYLPETGQRRLSHSLIGVYDFRLRLCERVELRYEPGHIIRAGLNYHFSAF